LIIFVVFSAGFVLWSRPFLHNPRSRGFFHIKSRVVPRFVALHQIDWWVLLSISLFLVVHGFHLPRVIGKTKDNDRERTAPSSRRFKNLPGGGDLVKEVRVRLSHEGVYR
jgi:hypothetical protein